MNKPEVIIKSNAEIQITFYYQNPTKNSTQNDYLIFILDILCEICTLAYVASCHAKIVLNEKGTGIGLKNMLKNFSRISLLIEMGFENFDSSSENLKTFKRCKDINFFAVERMGPENWFNSWEEEFKITHNNHKDLIETLKRAVEFEIAQDLLEDCFWGAIYYFIINIKGFFKENENYKLEKLVFTLMFFQDLGDSKNFEN